jgi:hypothetical protein
VHAVVTAPNSWMGCWNVCVVMHGCRFGFRSDLLRAMYAVTDGFSGLNGTWDTPGTGMNFLVHNMVRARTLALGSFIGSCSKPVPLQPSCP